jgi:hypothetical protein
LRQKKSPHPGREGDFIQTVACAERVREHHLGELIAHQHFEHLAFGRTAADQDGRKLVRARSSPLAVLLYWHQTIMALLIGLVRLIEADEIYLPS